MKIITINEKANKMKRKGPGSQAVVDESSVALFADVY